MCLFVCSATYYVNGKVVLKYQGTTAQKLCFQLAVHIRSMLLAAGLARLALATFKPQLPGDLLSNESTMLTNNEGRKMRENFGQSQLCFTSKKSGCEASLEG